MSATAFMARQTTHSDREDVAGCPTPLTSNASSARLGMRRSFRSADGGQRWLHADLAAGMVPVAGVAGRNRNPNEGAVFDRVGSRPGQGDRWGDPRDPRVDDL